MAKRCKNLALLQAVRIFSSDIEMQITKWRNDKITKRSKGYKYLGELLFDSVKNKEIKDMITKKYYRRI